MNWPDQVAVTVQPYWALKSAKTLFQPSDSALFARVLPRMCRVQPPLSDLLLAETEEAAVRESASAAQVTAIDRNRLMGLLDSGNDCRR